MLPRCSAWRNRRRKRASRVRTRLDRRVSQAPRAKPRRLAWGRNAARNDARDCTEPTPLSCSRRAVFAQDVCASCLRSVCPREDCPARCRRRGSRCLSCDHRRRMTIVFFSRADSRHQGIGAEFTLAFLAMGGARTRHRHHGHPPPLSLCHFPFVAGESTILAPTSVNSRWNSGESRMTFAAAARRRSTASSVSTNEVGNPLR